MKILFLYNANTHACTHNAGNFRLQYRAEFPMEFTLSFRYCKEIL